VRGERNDTCRHYNGTFDNKTSDAGVLYRDVTPDPDSPGCALRIPCKTTCGFTTKRQLDEFAKRGTCSKFELLTQDEFDKREAETEAALQESLRRMELVAPLIRRIKSENRKKSNSGTETCPACGKDLYWSISGYNGHVHMRCQTANCIAFME
jgi:hypothetical protein